MRSLVRHGTTKMSENAHIHNQPKPKKKKQPKAAGNLESTGTKCLENSLRRSTIYIAPTDEVDEKYSNS